MPNIEIKKPVVFLLVLLMFGACDLDNHQPGFFPGAPIIVVNQNPSGCEGFISQRERSEALAQAECTMVEVDESDRDFILGDLDPDLLDKNVISVVLESYGCAPSSQDYVEFASRESEGDVEIIHFSEALGGQFGCSCAADLNGDGVVNAYDLALLLGAWGPCSGCQADFTDDGVINAYDLALLLGAWGPCPEI